MTDLYYINGVEGYHERRVQKGFLAWIEGDKLHQNEYIDEDVDVRDPLNDRYSKGAEKGGHCTNVHWATGPSGAAKRERVSYDTTLI